jgi:hypothetical protein
MVVLVSGFIHELTSPVRRLPKAAERTLRSAEDAGHFAFSLRWVSDCLHRAVLGALGRGHR